MSGSRFRPALVLLAATLLAVTGMVAVASGAAAAVEDDGADCPVSLPGSFPDHTNKTPCARMAERCGTWRQE